MNRAFIRSSDDDTIPEDLPERPISPHPNLVTVEGLARIEAELASLRRRHAAAVAAGNAADTRRLERDLRYWAARRHTAEVVAPPPPGRVAFGSRVTVRYDDGREQHFRIVGEDEADPARGTVSYVSPIACALIGGEVGEMVRIGTDEAEIVDIRSN